MASVSSPGKNDMMQEHRPSADPARLHPPTNWLAFIRRYLLLAALFHLLWEFSHMPLYTLWHDGDAVKILAYGLHCTAGDIAIAAASLLTALLLLGRPDWPTTGYGGVAALTLAIGFFYTAYSEYLNVYVRQSWAYHDSMPLLPPFDIGASPLLQWLVIPGIIFYLLGPRNP